jgi:hypothetical protein
MEKMTREEMMEKAEAFIQNNNITDNREEYDTTTVYMYLVQDINQVRDALMADLEKGWDLTGYLDNFFRRHGIEWEAGKNEMRLEKEKMKLFINTTPHPIRMQTRQGHLYTIQPCGTLINARPIEEVVPVENHPWGPYGVELVRTRFEADPESEEALTRLEAENPGWIIVGSIIAAQAFPGRVLAMVPVAGFERVPPAEKRMRDYKFTVFSSDGEKQTCPCCKKSFTAEKTLQTFFCPFCGVS